MMNKSSTRYFSSNQEKRVAKAVGGRRTANSGATMFSKGDVVIEDLFLIECKTSVKDKESFTIHREWFDKNEEEAFAMGKPYEAVVFDFGDGKQHYVINETLFRKLVEFLREENNNGENF